MEEPKDSKKANPGVLPGLFRFYGLNFACGAFSGLMCVNSRLKGCSPRVRNARGLIRPLARL